MTATGVVLDASAALASILGEKGGEDAFAQFSGAAISTVNWAEVVERAITAGAAVARLRADFRGMGVRLVPVEAADAEYAAQIRQPTRSAGLSLADRLCLALAARERVAVLTADRAWAGLNVGVEVRLIR